MARKASYRRGDEILLEQVPLLGGAAKERLLRPIRPTGRRPAATRTQSTETPAVPLDPLTVQSLFDATAQTARQATLAREGLVSFALQIRGVSRTHVGRPAPAAPVTEPKPRVPRRARFAILDDGHPRAATTLTGPLLAGVRRRTRLPLLLACAAVALSTASLVIAHAAWRATRLPPPVHVPVPVPVPDRGPGPVPAPVPAPGPVPVPVPVTAPAPAPATAPVSAPAPETAGHGHGHGHVYGRRARASPPPEISTPEPPPPPGPLPLNPYEGG